MLHGEEDAVRRDALKELLASSGADDFEIEIFEGDQLQPTQWIASASSVPFISERRVVVVRHLLRAEPDQIKAEQLKGLPDYSLLVLMADEEASDDQSKQSRFNAIAAKWAKLVRDGGGMVASFDVNQSEVKGAIKQRARAAGKQISEAAADTLADMTSCRTGRALEELDKVLLFIGDSNQVREADIAAVVVPSRDWNVFKLVDATLLGNVQEALTQLRILVTSPTKAEDAAYRNILPQVHRSLRLLWQAVICNEMQVSPASAPPHVVAMFPDKPNLAKEKDFVQGKIMRLAKRLNLETLSQCFEVLEETDARLKGQAVGFTALDALERMILEMAELVVPRRAG